MQTATNPKSAKDFLILWAGQSVSSLGTSMTSFALILWAYQQQGTASSVAFLSAFTFLPKVFFSFLAGALADRWDKKKIMVLGDSFAALGSAAILILSLTGRLQVWHLYGINFLLSFMGAFQSPAANVLITVLTPGKNFARSNGLFALSGAIETILTPAIATALFWARGLVLVLVIDLATFAVAVISLLALVRVPPIPRQEEVRKERFARSCLFGIRYLARHPGMLWTILLFMVLNLLENCGLFGLRSAYVLAAPGGGEAALALVNALAGVGALAGSALVSLMRPARSRSRVFLWACLLGCVLNDLPMALGRGAPVWAGAALMGGLLMPLLNANLTAGMRARVPVALQGRVFAARDTLQCWTMPVGMFLGGVLADHVFEPFMASGSPMAAALARLVGRGPGSGIAVLFLITATASIALAATALCHPVFREMDGDDPAL